MEQINNLVAQITEQGVRQADIQWGLACSVALVFFVVYRISYAYVLSPVARVPGPWWARLSKLPLLYATFKGYRAKYAQDLLDKYGPLVVIAPDQVHTSDEEAMKAIYDRTSIKTSFYLKMGSWKGVRSTLGILDYPAAAPTRNNLIQCFQNRNLDILSDHIVDHVATFVEALKKRADGTPSINGIFWFRLLALDIVTDVLWGEQTELVKNADAGGVESVFIRRFHAFSKYNALRSFIPGLDLFVRCFGPPKWTQLRNDLNDLDQTACDALARWEKGSKKAHDKDVLSMLANLNNHSDPSKRIPNSHIPAYLVEMLAAGSSTTAATATFCVHELSFAPEKQKKLREELFAAFADPASVTLETAQTLPYLKACVKETLRVYPVIPGPLERWVGTPFTVNGITVGRGAIASTSAFTQGRLEEVFPLPNEWEPERWLVDDEDSAEFSRMKLNWTPFGYGSRACPGSNLALNELHLMIASIFRNLKAVNPKEGQTRKVALLDHFTAGPVGGKVMHAFVPAAEEA